MAAPSAQAAPEAPALDARLAEISTQLDDLHRAQVRVESVIDHFRKDLSLLPLRLKAPDAVSVWPPPRYANRPGAIASTQPGAVEPKAVAAAAGPGVQERKVNERKEANDRGREARCQTPLAHIEGCFTCNAAGKEPAAVIHHRDHVKTEARARSEPRARPQPIPPLSPTSPVSRGTAASRGQRSRGNGASEQCPASPGSGRAPTKESSNVSGNRQQHAKDWSKKRGARATASDLVQVEGWGQLKRSKTTLEQEARLEALEANIMKEESASLSSRLRRLILGTAFDSACLAVVFVNSVFIGYSVNYMAENKLDDVPQSFVVLNYTFTGFFIIELLLRIFAWRKDFLKPPDGGWNALDFIVVLFSLLEIVFENVDMGEAQEKLDVQMLRIVRVLRVVKAVRALRVLRFFRELRMMVYSIIGCMRSLFWAMALLFIVLYITATYLTQVATTYRVDADNGDELAESLADMYGTLMKTIYFLFQAVSGGSDWGDVAEPMLELGWVYGVIFTCFVCFTLFSVLNIVTGIFVEVALERAQLDKEAMIQSELDEQQSQATELEQVFKEIDTDGSGILELNEFEELMKDPRVKAWFRAMGLRIDQAVHLFRLLDLDNSDSVSSSEFIMGCLRLKGDAKNVDVATLMYENKRMMMKWTAFMDFVEDKFDEMKEHVSSVLGRPDPLLDGYYGGLEPEPLEADTGPEQLKERRPSRWSMETSDTSVNIYDNAIAQQNEVANGRRKSWRQDDDRQSLNIYGGDE